MPRTCLNPGRLQQMRRMYEVERMTIREIAEAYRISVRAVYYQFEDYGVTYRGKLTAVERKEQRDKHIFNELNASR